MILPKWFPGPKKLKRYYQSCRALRQLACELRSFPQDATILARYGGIGDVVCTLAACEKLKSLEPHKTIIFITAPFYRDIPTHSAAVDHVIVTPVDLRLPVMRQLLGLQLAHTPHIYAPKFSDEWGPSVSTEVLHLCASAQQQLQLPTDFVFPHLSVPKTTIEIPSQPYAVIHPGPTSKVREWPQAYWEQLIAQLGMPVHQIGHAYLQKIQGRSSHPTIIQGVRSHVNEYTVSENMSLISQASLFIGVDSGYLHISSAYRTPTIGLFGSTCPRLRLNPESGSGLTSNVPCLGCHHKYPLLHWNSNCPNNVQCMAQLTPLQVLKEAHRLSGV